MNSHFANTSVIIRWLEIDTMNINQRPCLICAISFLDTVSGLFYTGDSVELVYLTKFSLGFCIRWNNNGFAPTWKKMHKLELLKVELWRYIKKDPRDTIQNIMLGKISLTLCPRDQEHTYKNICDKSSEAVVIIFKTRWIHNILDQEVRVVTFSSISEYFFNDFHTISLVRSCYYRPVTQWLLCSIFFFFL